jgi:oxygen-dependent protoporphyrinogen oxidase
MRVVVVGGGIAGLAAAHRLVQRGVSEVLLLEQAPVLGGKLHTTSLAGGMVERGAEAFLTTDPSATDLATGLGLELAHPTPAKAAVAIGGGLRDLPAGTLLGIPLSPVPGVPDEPSAGPLLRAGEDVTVGALVRPRRGDEVVDTYVEPLLGGVYAGHADALSLRMAIPALATAAETAHTLTDALRAAVAARAPSGVAAVPAAAPGGAVAPAARRPMFATVVGGVSRLVDAVAAGLPEVRTDATVRKLRPHGAGWRLTVGPARRPSTVDCAAVVLAVPAAPAARLLSTVEGIRPVPLDYASVVLVALDFRGLPLPELSGFLVPPREGLAVKAATFFDRKWAHQRRTDGVSVVRASLGRAGETAVLQRPDEDLVGLVRDELGGLLAGPLGAGALPPHVDAGVYRWGGALPQYAPGHADRVRELRAGLPSQPPMAVAGAAYDGVGIPACVRSGRTAADEVLDRLAGARGPAGKGERIGT